MPNRIIREGINSSGRINRLSDGAELLYRRLMSVADDYGRYHASPATLRGACWPTMPDKVSECQVSEWMEELTSSDRPLIVIYSVDEAKYLEIQDFNQQTRTKSKFPSRPDINLPADCEQNVGTRRRRIAEAKAKAASEEPPPPTVKEIKDQLQHLAFPGILKAPPTREDFPNDNIRRYMLAKDCLMRYPGVERLTAKLDDGIIKQCLEIAGNDLEALQNGLLAMHRAGKGPTQSWAFFPAVLKHHVGNVKEIRRAKA